MDNIVDEIKSRCNIVDVIAREVVLKKTGANHKGLCPFHNEKTPSFIVSETKQMFYCFGCNTAGDVFEFVQKYYNLDFPQALEKLAGQCGNPYRRLRGNGACPLDRMERERGNPGKGVVEHL